MEILAFNQYLTGKYGDVIESVRNTNNTAQGIQLVFRGGVSADIKAAAQAEIAGFDFAPADVLGFELLITSDATIPPVAKLVLMQQFPLLEGHVREGSARMNYWALLKGVYATPGGPLDGNCSDGVAITTKVEQLAAQCHMRLAP